VIKLRILDYPGLPTVITGVLIRGKPEGQKKRDVVGCYIVGIENERWSQGTRWPLKAGKARQRISPTVSRRSSALPTP
jgi:hypothetical protein